MTDLHELAAAYALDALEPDEEASFEEHLGTCLDCRREVTALGDAAASLASAEEMEPPEHLRQRVMEATQDIPQDRIEAPAPVGGAPGWRSWLPRFAAPALAAAVVAMIVMTAALIQQGNRLEEARDVQRLLAVGDATVATFEANDVGSIRFVHSASEDRGILIGSDVPAVDANSTYQFWIIDADGPRSAGLFRPTAGEFQLNVADVGEALALGVTREPSGGSPQPTGGLVYVVDLSTQ